MKLLFTKKINALPLLFSLVAFGFGTVTAQSTTEKSILLKSGELVEIEDLNFKNLFEINVVPNNYNDIMVSPIISNGKIFVETPAGLKGKRTITIQHKNHTKGDTLIGYRIYDLNFVPSLITANDDIKEWDGSGTRVVDILDNDIIIGGLKKTGLKKILINYVPKDYKAEIIQNKLYVSTTGSNLNAHIQYTIVDTLGGSDQAIVTLRPEINYTEDRNFRFVVNYSGKKLIQLPNGYEIQSYPINGQLNNLDNIFYEYTPQNYYIGRDSFVFQSPNGLRISYYVNIIDASKDPGLIKDDVFYVTPDKTLDFDVLANDLIQDIDISDFSYQLEDLSDGWFRYGGGSTGVKNYYYSSSTLESEETGRIKINVSTYSPDNIDYSVNLLSNTLYAFDYDVPIVGYGFTVANAPLHGTIDFYMGETPEMECGKGHGKYMILYKPNANYVGQDEVTLNYCIDGTNCRTARLKFNIVENTTETCACVNDCVYPGDLNGDGRVSADDILVLGRYMGAVGPQRANLNNAIWLGEQSSKWGIANSKDNDLMHADANGDGILNQEDIDYIYQNYGKVKGFVPKPPLGFKDFPFEIIAYPEVVDSGETQTLYFVLGSEEIPANAVHGMSFALNLGPIDSSSFEFELYPDSWLTEGAPSIGVAQQTKSGVVNIGLTIAQGASVVGEEGDGVKATGVSGYGIIAKATYVVGEEGDGVKVKNTFGNRDLTAYDVEMEDTDGEIFSLYGSSVQIRVRPNAEAAEKSIDIFTYPNPVSDRLTISAGKRSIESANLYDVTGRLIISSIPNYKTSEIHLDVSKLDKGIYITKMMVDGEEFTNKVIKK